MDANLKRALVSLQGLSVGDAFGERFFVHPNVVKNLIAERAVPAGPWKFTDDTMMAMSIVEILARFGRINQDRLAESFAQHYDQSRGYGPSMHNLLNEIRLGGHWHQLAHALFDGKGSYGNGSAMRVAPIGAFFADDLERVVEQAALSSEVTHTNSEAVAGAIAVAVAAAWCYRLKSSNTIPTHQEFIDLVLQSVPPSEVAHRLRTARTLDQNEPISQVAGLLGNGSFVSAQDTVPFSIWCAGRYISDFEEALWQTVSGEGDRDTTCAIVGGIVALFTGEEGIPEEWLATREPLLQWCLID